MATSDANVMWTVFGPTKVSLIAASVRLAKLAEDSDPSIGFDVPREEEIVWLGSAARK